VCDVLWESGFKYSDLFLVEIFSDYSEDVASFCILNIFELYGRIFRINFSGYECAI